MKKISEVHFDRMIRMCNKFELSSKTNKLYLPEYEISKEINEMIMYIEKPSQSDYKKIEELIKGMNRIEHHNGSQWYDYKIHVNAVMLENGFDSNLF